MIEAGRETAGPTLSLNVCTVTTWAADYQTGLKRQKICKILFVVYAVYDCAIYTKAYFA